MCEQKETSDAPLSYPQLDGIYPQSPATGKPDRVV
jgi:hypothetical protein